VRPTRRTSLVLAGECLLLIEGEERPLKAWDFVHCPPNTEHAFVGAGDGSCVIFMTGARKGWPEKGIVYPRSELALRQGAGVEKETTSPAEAYAPFRSGSPGCRATGTHCPGPSSVQARGELHIKPLAEEYLQSFSRKTTEPGSTRGLRGCHLGSPRVTVSQGIRWN
jgi:hypothetical protein